MITSSIDRHVRSTADGEGYTVTANAGAMCAQNRVNRREAADGGSPL